MKRSIYDKFGEEGLKGGIPQEFGSETPWATGYVFHGNAEKVFHEFFGGNNPFSGKRFYLSPRLGHSCKDAFLGVVFFFFYFYIYMYHGKEIIY